MDYLVVWSKNPAAYIQKDYYDQDSTTRLEKKNLLMMKNSTWFCRWVVWDVQIKGWNKKSKEIDNKNKARLEIISESVISSYNHKFGSFLFGTQLNFRSSVIENAILPKKLQLDLKKKMEASRTAYEFLIMQHAALKCILEQKYDR